MLLLSPLELPPLGEPVSSENRRERRARMKRERQHATDVPPFLFGFLRRNKGMGYL
jgi:hypothetical protein